MDQELENCHLKIKVMTKKFTANVGAISKAKEQMESELSRTHTLAFLQVKLTCVSGQVVWLRPHQRSLITGVF